MHLGKAERVRLYGVDTPEKNQAFGTRAKQFTSEQAFGRDVRVVVKDTDRYGRTVGDVFLPNGKRLSNELVRAGMAWWYQQYAPKDTKLMRRHLDANSKKVGLWADALPVAPWDFRRGRGSAAEQATTTQHNETDLNFVNRSAEPSSQPGERVLQPEFGAGQTQQAPRTNVQQRAAPQVQQQAVAVYVTNTGKKYHRDGCRYLSKSKIPMVLSSAKASYGACSVCKPPS